MENENVFDPEFNGKHSVIKLLNYDNTLIGTFLANNNGILLETNKEPKFTLKYISSYPNQHSSFPIEKLSYDTNPKKLLDLESKIFPFPDEHILTSINDIKSKLIDKLEILRINPIEILKKKFEKKQSEKKIRLLLNLSPSNKLLQDISQVRNKIKIISPQRYIFKDNIGEIYLTMSPAGQLINLDQMEYTHLVLRNKDIIKELSNYNENIKKQGLILSNAKNSETSSFVLAENEVYKNACLRLKLMYTSEGMQYLEKQKFTSIPFCIKI